jgi:hypothetical protein
MKSLTAYSFVTLYIVAGVVATVLEFCALYKAIIPQ